MTRRTALSSMVIATSVCVGWLAVAPARAEAQPEPTPADPASLLPNGRHPRPGLLTGGQPSPEQLAAIAAAGYRTLVDLRVPGETGDTRAEDVERLGMRYVRIPVAGAGGVTEANARALAVALGGDEALPAVVHCQSGNRVGALLALEAHLVDGLGAEDALQLGLDAGLRGLEPVVRDRLGVPAP